MTPVSSPLVAVTQRIDYLGDRNETRDAVDQKLTAWLVAAGYLPVTVPNSFFAEGFSPEASATALAKWLEAIGPSALVLSGGNDIGVFPSRDETEAYLLSWAQREKVPLLGICRGLQMIAVWAGTELVPVSRHVATRHALNPVKPDEAPLWPAQVNSYHNWGLTSCPDGFEVAATAEDGSIEAIRHQSLPWQGWMWHPEREPEFDQRDSARLRGLFGDP